MELLNFKGSLFLPKTKFHMRGGLNVKELELIKFSLKLVKHKPYVFSNTTSTSSVIHDGPPFTNGNIHVGTALNKILKDVTNRYSYWVNGNAYPLIPGWDCHGLPIENKAIAFTRVKGNGVKQQLKVRILCKKISKKYIKLQQKQFKRLGLLIDWSLSYKTMDNCYESRVIGVFNNLLLRKLIYFKNKPVYWSIPCKTALAEAEIEYNKKLSDSMYLRFKVRNRRLLKGNLSIYLVSWTTNPWTLVFNQALCLKKTAKYVILKVWNLKTLFLCTPKFLNNLLYRLNITRFKIIQKTDFNKKNINTYCINPVNLKLTPVLFDEYVDLSTGTGVIHLAPNHGFEDYTISLKKNIWGVNKLTASSVFNKTQLCSFVKKKFKNNFNRYLVNYLVIKGEVLLFEKIIHDYPYCWRSKTPLIFKSTKQWFLDTNSFLKKKALLSLKKVKYNPDKSYSRLYNLIKDRPDWCISRQRAWGVPMPIFFNEYKKPLVSGGLMKHLKSLVYLYNSNILYTKSAKSLLHTLKTNKNFTTPKLSFCKETFDVWFVSGNSYLTLNKKGNLTYIEGNDQHRGWFQSSLWLGLLYKNYIPYNKLTTHGFIVDKGGLKFSKSSKSKKNKLFYIMENYGSDLLKLWFCSENPYNDIFFSEKILNKAVNTYRMFRNTFKFMLGNLFDLNIYKDKLSYSLLKKWDRFFLHKTFTHIKSFFSWNKGSLDVVGIVKKTTLFCSNFLSVKFQKIKERLYTYPLKSIGRRSCQSSLYLILNGILKVLSPVLFFTSIEVLNTLRKLQFNSPLHSCDFAIPSNVDNSYICYNPIINIINSTQLQFIQRVINKFLEIYLNKFKIIGICHNSQIEVILGIKWGYYSRGAPRYFFCKKNNENFNLSNFTRKGLQNPNRSFFKLNRLGRLYCRRSWKNYKKLVWGFNLGFTSKISKKSV